MAMMKGGFSRDGKASRAVAPRVGCRAVPLRVSWTNERMKFFFQG